MGQDLLIFHFSQFPLFFLGGKMNITPHCYSLSEKVVAALIVTGECGAETIAVTIKKMQYIFPLLIFGSSYFPTDVPLNMHNRPTKTTQVRMNLPHFMTFSGLHVFSSAVVIAQCPSN